jgi:hypothetical protein
LAFLLHGFISQHHLAFVCNVERVNKIRKGRKRIKEEEHKIKTVTEGNKYK